MKPITPSDREILRALARRKLELASSAENERILKLWHAQAEGRRDTPPIRLLFSNFTDEVITARMRCQGEEARQIEWKLLDEMVGRELFGDDTPLSPTYDIPLFTSVDPFGTQPHMTQAENSIGFHIDPVTDDPEADIDLFKHGSFSADPEGTDAWAAYVGDILGDILPTRITMNGLTAAMTNPLVQLIGMENYYLAMYDSPDAIHDIMNTACTLYENFFDMLEKRGLLRPTNDFSMLPQESFAFTRELPHDKVTSTREMWGFLESQETTAVSPEAYGEFVYPYMDRLVRRWGLLSYGCCERVDALFEPYLSRWKNLRKLSVSPFNDERKIGDFLRGTNIVYYSKPRAEYVTNPGPLDEEATLQYFKGVCEAASGCLFEIAQREVGTIFGDYNRGRRYVELAREAVEKYWRP